jgi:membrane associated rhomboid family serine protease
VRKFWNETPVVAAMLFSNTLIHVVDQLMGNKLLAMGVKMNPLIMQGQVYRLLTCTFLHANLVHLAVRFLYRLHCVFIQTCRVLLNVKTSL